MALAIIELLDLDESKARFNIDTGTNTRYQLRIGRDVHQEDGCDRLDDVYFSTPYENSDGGDDLFGTTREVTLPLSVFAAGRSFVQLVTTKAGGKAQAISDAVPMAGAFLMSSVPVSGATAIAGGSAMTLSYRQARAIPHRTEPLARQASIESVLGELVKIASPIVLKLLTGAKDMPAAGTQTDAPLGILAQVLQSLLGLASTPAKSRTASMPQVLAMSAGAGNRFVSGGRSAYAKPLIFGIDDALLAGLVGPVLQILPQLMNAANQKRIELKKADNQLIGGILSDINKRLLMEKLLEAQQAAQAQGPAALVKPEQIKTVMDLLAQLPAVSVASTASIAASLPPGETESATPNRRAMLNFSFAPAVQWNGEARPIFDKNRSLVLRPRLTVMEPAPKAPLPKAILKLVLQDAGNPAVRHEKIFKLKNLLPNATIECAFEPGELAHLPPNTLFAVLAELRWPNANRDREIRALGASEIVLVDKYFLKARGPEMSAERELTDMTRYRPFWNKIWEAPVLDGAGGGAKKYTWELNVTTRYSCLLSSGHDANGIMETKMLKEADDPDNLTLNIRGRMKAGIELSLSELNKLIPLWNGLPVLDAARLEALSAHAFLAEATREFKYNFRLKGRAGQNGMIWVIPVFKLFGLTLSRASAADETGQVTATADEDVQFPLPVAARLIGLKSAEQGGA